MWLAEREVEEGPFICGSGDIDWTGGVNWSGSPETVKKKKAKYTETHYTGHNTWYLVSVKCGQITV